MKQVNSSEIVKRMGIIAKDMHIGLLQGGRPVYLNASGSSMYPFVKGGDILKVVSVKKENQIKIGDMVAVDLEKTSDAWFCLHRVVSIFEANGRKMYITKGDANTKSVDRAFGFDRLIGKLAEVERNGLKIDYERPLWDKYLNRWIAGISLKHGKTLRIFAPYVSLFLERRWAFSKLRRRFNEPLCNAEELILICARTNQNQKLIKKAKDLLTKGIDWKFFRKTAIESKTPFIFYNSLNKIDCPSIVPKQFLGKLKENYLYVMTRALAQHRETTSLLKLFFEKNIPVIPLKGPILSGRIYGEIAARGISTDIDLLVEEKNKDSAGKLLEEEGYIFQATNGKRKDHLWQYIYSKPENTPIDFHWEINSVALNKERMKGFWESAKLREENNTFYYDFEKEELLLCLSAHFVDSAYLTELRYACDINELLTKHKGTLDWTRIVKNAKKWRLSGSLYATLCLTQKLFCSHIPDEVLKSLRPGVVKNFFIEIFTSKKIVLHKNSKRKHFINSFLKYLLFQILEAQSVKDYFHILFPVGQQIKNKTYFQRFVSGINKFMKVLK